MTSDRGSVFIYCPLLERYPAQPVLECHLFRPARNAAAGRMRPMDLRPALDAALEVASPPARCCATTSIVRAARGETSTRRRPTSRRSSSSEPVSSGPSRIGASSARRRGASRPRTGKPIWLVDPNDGTRDYLVGRRGSAVSIGLLRDRRPVLGVVFAFGYPDDDGDLFAWAEGCGPVTRNGRPVTPRLPEPISARRRRSRVEQG